MADEALKAKPGAPLFTEGFLKILIASVLAYWGLFALALPVTNLDSQVYHLARLCIAERAGFWQTTAWNSVRQVIFPWTFDALHYPFLKLGWGFALPSFLAFSALLVITFELVAAKYGRKAGFWSLLILLAMPTLMLQATVTSTDVAVAFGVACWLYSFVRFRKQRDRFFLFTAALSLAFAAGCKTSAPPISALLAVATIWRMRTEPKEAVRFAIFFVLLLPFFASIETYLLSWKIYGNPMGPAGFVQPQTNRDGIQGATANFIRYNLSAISTGIDGIDCRSGFPPALETVCRQLLHQLNLGNVGYRPDYNDATMRFLKNGSDSGSDYGLVGFIALAVASVLVWLPRLRRSPWVLVCIGFAFAAFISAGIAWMPWNARFLCISFILFGVTLAIFVFASPNERSWTQAGLGLIILWSVISVPLHCGQRRPLDFWNSFFARADLSFLQRWDLKRVYDDVLALRQTANASEKWFLVAGENSWTLPFLQMPGMNWEFTPKWNQVLPATESAGESNEEYALVLDGQLPKNLPVNVVKSYPSGDYIVEIPPNP
jgi:4-amino-4-deoxy-L-arabinose transferase-like glycosyltransferase